MHVISCVHKRFYDYKLYFPRFTNLPAFSLDNGNIRLDDDGVSGRIDLGIGRTASRDGLVDDRIGRYFGHHGVEPLACIYCDIFNLHCFVFRWLKNLGSER